MESNVVVVATTSTVVEADPSHPSAINQANQPIPDMVGQGGEVLGSTGDPYMGHNRNAYPCGLPLNYTPPTMHMPNENANHVVPVIFESQQPQPVGGTMKNLRNMLRLTLSHNLHSPLRDQHVVVCLCPIIREHLNPARCDCCISQ